MSQRFTGLIAATHTPFDAAGGLNLDAVPAIGAHLQRSGVTAAFIAGSTGESHSLTVDERLSLAQCWQKTAADCGLRLIVHVGHNCQRDAIRLAAHAASIKADAIASAPPNYFKPATVEDLINFCQPVAAAAPDTPFYFYDIPSLTGVVLPMPAFLMQGKQAMPNLTGLKYTNADQMQFQECVHLDGGSFDILSGFDEVLLASLSLGAKGAVGSTYNFAAPLYLGVIKAFENGDFALARQLQLQSVKLVRVCVKYGFMGAAKSIMQMLGVDCGPVRPPLSAISAQQQKLLKAELTELGFFEWISHSKA